jgi:hypothetical protein
MALRLPRVPAVPLPAVSTLPFRTDAEQAPRAANVCLNIQGKRLPLLAKGVLL